MIYIKNNTEIQTIFIPRNELQKEAYIASTKTYEDGYKDGFGKGKQYQKDQLLNLYVTENGEYEREDGWGIVTVDIPIEECPDCPEGGTCNLGEGEIVLDTTMAGTYELYASDDGYDGWSKFYVTLENGGAIKVHKASDLLDTFNNGEQIDYGAYYYVGGKITEIQEVNTQYGNATYTLDNGFLIYRGKWMDDNPFWDENQIKVGAYIVVYGVIADYRGTLQFNKGSQVIAYQECEGGEIVSCNIQEYKWVRPSMADRAENGDIYIYPDEGFDAVGYIDFDPSDIYNEGVSAGKAEGGDLNIDAVSTSLGAGNWTKWTRNAAEYGLDGMSEITIDGSQYQEWTKAHTLLQAYQNTEEAYITENGEYRPNIGYDGFALNGNNVAWVIDVIPTIDTDVEIWVKPYDNAPNMWQGFIGSQANDDDNTTFQIRKVDGSNTFSFRFGEQIFEYGFEYERWYRLRMNRNGVWVNGEQVCGWDVQAFEENPNPLMINGIYNLNFENENYRMNFASYGYVYFHNTDKLYVPFKNGLFFGNGVQTIGRPIAEGATLQYENNWFPKGYTKVTVDVPQNGGGESEDCNIQNQKRIDLYGERETFYPDEGYDGIFEVVVDASRKAEEWREEGRRDVKDKLQTIDITENGRYSTDDQISVQSLRYNGGYHTDTISTYDINRIEVTFKADTSESINIQGQPFILGGSLWGLNESGEDNECARAIQYAFGRIVGYWEGKWTDAAGCMDGEWLTITLDENGMIVKYPTYEERKDYTHNNGKVNSGVDIFPFIIGGEGKRKDLEDGNYTSNLIEDSQFRGLIKEVKINTNSMGEITYIPKNWGYGVWDRKVENTGEYLSALEPTEGEILFNDEWERKYGEGWKEINVNVENICPSAQEQITDYNYNQITLYSYRNISLNDFEGCFYDSNNEPITDVLVIVEKVGFEYAFKLFTKVAIKTCSKIPYPNNPLYGLTRLYFKSIPFVKPKYKDNDVLSLYIEDVGFLNMDETTLNGLLRIWLKGSTTFRDGLEIGTAQIKDGGTIYSDGTNTDKLSSSFTTWTIINDHKLP